MSKTLATSWRLRWRLWRARYSAPALLARLDERKAISVLAAVHAGLGIALISIVAWVTKLPLLFPALGPSSFILFTTPLAPTASPRNVIGGHWISLAVGLLVWRVLGLIGGTPPPPWLPYVGAAIAMAGACWAMVRLELSHPPACASALVVALGSVPNEWHILLMGATVIQLAMQAVVLNKLAGLPVSWWAPRKITPQA